MRVAGLTALVTGGAAGLGLALSEALLAQGCTLIAVGRDTARLTALAAAYPGRVVPLATDLAEPADVDRLIARITADHPDLAVLINNAGVQHALPHDDPARAIALSRHEIAVNLSAPIALSLGLLPVLARQPHAAIVQIGSGLGLAPKAQAPAYGATKAGLSALARALRYRCEDYCPQVKVFDIMLPLVDTAMTAGRGRGKLSPQRVAALIIEALAKDRFTAPLGKARLLAAIHRIAPALAYRIMRNGQ